MKKNQVQSKKYPVNNKKKEDNSSPINLGKKNISFRENNSTLFKFFKISSIHKSTSTPVVPETRQTTINLNKEKTDSQQNYRLSKYEFYKSKKNKNLLLKKLTKSSEENENNKIDVSGFILFNENFTNEIYDIFMNNFIRTFKRYIEDKYKIENNKIGNNDLTLSKLTFNKFIQQMFKYFIVKYLLNTYHNLIYVPEKYMMQQNEQNNLNEVGLLVYNDKENIYLEYSPINLIECNLFYPKLCSNISKFIKYFKQKKRKKNPNSALLLYRPNDDFTSYINKIKLICNQLGYRLLIREDEINKLMNIEKLKEINQNYIIGSLQEKNIKYLKILDNISKTEKWTNFLEYNNIQLIESKEKGKKINKQNIKKSNISKTQSTVDMTQNISKNLLNIKNNKDIGINIFDNLSSQTLTFIGHNNKNCEPSQESDQYSSKEYKIFQNYQQNILEKFNKRRNVILFVDNFEKNEDNIKYINQINTIIPTSKSPIIILTNNLSIFTDNQIIGSTSFQNRYIPHQIENEGINQKENVIYITFLIIYFLIFIPKVSFEYKIKEETINFNKEKEKETEEEKELNFVIQINNNSELSNNSNENINNKNYNLEKIKKAINNIFTDTELNSNNNEVYSSLINLSNIISMMHNYEINDILVYLKNLFQLIKNKIEDNSVKKNIKEKILLLESAISIDIEKYKIEEDTFINSDNNIEEDISKIANYYDNNSFLDYEYGYISNIAEKQYEEKLRNYGINKGVDYNKESYFYSHKYCYDYKYSNKFNYISNKEVQERIIEDHKFFQNYYNYNNIILNHIDITKINMILIQIITNDRISIEDTSKFIGTRYSKRNNYKTQNNNLNNNYIITEKISLLNKLFRKCPLDIFTRYINAHYGIKYNVNFTLEDKKYSIPEKLIFYNYYNDYYLMEQIQSEQKNKYKENEEDEEDEFDDVNDSNEDDDLNENEEEEEEYEEDYNYNN